MATSREDDALRLIREIGLARPRDSRRTASPASSSPPRARGTGRRAGARASTSPPATRRRPSTRSPRSPSACPAACSACSRRCGSTDLTTQSPAEVWIALPEKARSPRLDYPRLRVARFSGPALTEGIESTDVGGRRGPRLLRREDRRRLLQVPQQGGHRRRRRGAARLQPQHRGGATELARYARICRVSRVMQPYLDAIA